MKIPREREQLVDLVKELKLKKYPGIKNSVYRSSNQRKKRKLNREGQIHSLDLPDLSDDAVAFTVMQLILDPRFGPFVTELETIVEGCLSICNGFRASTDIPLAVTSGEIISSISSSSSTNSHINVRMTPVKANYIKEQAPNKRARSLEPSDEQSMEDVSPDDENEYNLFFG